MFLCFSWRPIFLDDEQDDVVPGEKDPFEIRSDQMLLGMGRQPQKVYFVGNVEDLIQYICPEFFELRVRYIDVLG